MPKFNKLVDMSRTTSQKPKVCRNLFGPIDHDETQVFLKRQFSVITDSSSQDWNFDFANEVPRLGGRYIWESVVRLARPESYDETVQTALDFDCNKFESESIMTCKNFPSDSRAVYKSHKGRRMIQSSIKGYLPVKKRPSEKLRISGIQKKLLFLRNSLRKADHCHHIHCLACPTDNRDQLKCSSRRKN